MPHLEEMLPNMGIPLKCAGPGKARKDLLQVLFICKSCSLIEQCEHSEIIVADGDRDSACVSVGLPFTSGAAGTTDAVRMIGREPKLTEVSLTCLTNKRVAPFFYSGRRGSYPKSVIGAEGF